MGGKKKPEKPKRPKKGPPPQFSDDIFTALVLESERGCVMLGVSLIDDELEKLLRAYFELASTPLLWDTFGEVGVEGGLINKLLTEKPMPPLGNLWIKNAIAHVLGIYSRRYYRLIDALREIRNDFAHLAYVLEITYGDARRLMDLLPDGENQVNQLLAQANAWNCRIPHSDSRQFSHARKVFVCVAMLAIGRIRSARVLLEAGVRPRWPKIDQAPESEQRPE